LGATERPDEDESEDFNDQTGSKIESRSSDYGRFGLSMAAFDGTQTQNFMPSGLVESEKHK
jgi:hypothetical protein